MQKCVVPLFVRLSPLPMIYLHWHVRAPAHHLLHATARSVACSHTCLARLILFPIVQLHICIYMENSRKQKNVKFFISFCGKIQRLFFITHAGVTSRCPWLEKVAA